jgi:carbamoyltransferase
MVLNTSVNENAFVVDRPMQALDCFARTDMDALYLGRYVLTNPSINGASRSDSAHG